ncbi:hypothetical protein [Lacihabitans sp. LS3-19]|uniref:hypothetical protein n=1 Tax=Lacihabitans sp. LS3-19 TaxID=2487335 RepID=UPI0020CBAE49|nr:hypothetical protein [Lacihabitans sp. LS3-19]
MKLADLHRVRSVSPHELDEYLEKGWFRMEQTIFTTNFLIFNNQYYNALWLKVKLDEFQVSKKQKALLKQNSRFRVEVSNGKITAEKEDLFFRYRNNLEFSIANSLQNLLLGESIFDIFDSYHINIFDDDKLIAFGVFDLGEKNAEGIVNVFDPDYRKFSLGKQLMIEKILFLKNQGFEHFFPGYFVPGYEQFDYKLKIASDATYFFDFGEQKWLPIKFLSEFCQPLDLIQTKLKSLEIILLEKGFKANLLKYNFFDISLVKGYVEYDLLDTPLVLYCFPNFHRQEALIVFDIFNKKYQFILCNKPFQSNVADIEGHYVKFLLKKDQIIFEEADIEVFASKFIDLIKN